MSWYIRAGTYTAIHKALAWDYDWDCGNLHVIDWWMWRHRLLPGVRTNPVTYQQWAECYAHRYLDGEEEREGIYR